ncbi:hypothetical protein ABPG72_021291 [Tetrahymena utriculariae]
MNNLRYQIYIYKIQDKRINFTIDLQKADLQDTLLSLGDFFNNKDELFEVEVNLGSGIGQLVDKQNLLNEFYDRIRNNLKYAINHIHSRFELQIIQILTIQIFDCLLNVEDIFLQLIKDLQYLKQLLFGSRKELSSYFFNQLLNAISFNRESLERLSLVFGVKEDQTDIRIHKKLDYIKHLFLNGLTYQIQLNAFKLAKRIEEVEIFNSFFSRLQIEAIVNELQVTKSSLQELYLDLDANNYLQTKNSLKSIEKLQDLRTLYLKTVSLKNENLDIQKLKKLEDLSLIFSDAIDYLSNHSNINQIVELEIVVGANDANKLKVKQLKKLRILHIVFKQFSQQETKKTISCIEKFSQIAHQFDELNLDFSESNYFQINTMSSQLIESIGLIFEKCNEETIISLTNRKCQFNTAKRFELAHQMMKVKNYQKFYLNNLCIYDQLYFYNQISSETLDYKFPYFLSIASQCQDLRNKVVNFDSSYLKDNYSVLKNKNSLFSNFSKFQLSKLHYYSKINLLSDYFMSILPKEVVFINLPKYFSMLNLIKNSKQFKQVKKIQFEETQIERFLEKIEPKQIKQIFTKNLNLKFPDMYSNYSYYKQQYQKLFDLEGYTIQITIISSFSQKDFVELFEIIQNKKNIIYLSLQHDYDYQLPYAQYQATRKTMKTYAQLITDYSTDMQIEVLTISVFNNYLIEHINLNPKLLYLDFYF